MSNKDALMKISRSTVESFPDCEAFDPRVRAAYNSTFLSINSPPLAPINSSSSGTGVAQSPCVIEIWNKDTISATNVLRAKFTNGEKIGVLNMASEKNPGGGFMTGAPAQEEALCRCTTLYPCLNTNKHKFYPIPTNAVLVSPDVFVIRYSHIEHYDFRAWSDCYFITVLSVAGLRHPALSADEQHYHRERDVQTMTIKIKELLRAAANNGCTVLVLGALGCGVFKNPPRQVARIFRDALRDDEFRYAFKQVVFAIIDSSNVQYGGVGTSNYAIFTDVFARS